MSTHVGSCDKHKCGSYCVLGLFGGPGHMEAKQPGPGVWCLTSHSIPPRDPDGQETPIVQSGKLMLPVAGESPQDTQLSPSQPPGSTPSPRLGVRAFLCRFGAGRDSQPMVMPSSTPRRLGSFTWKVPLLGMTDSACKHTRTHVRPEGEDSGAPGPNPF